MLKSNSDEKPFPEKSRVQQYLPVLIYCLFVVGLLSLVVICVIKIFNI